MTTYKPGDPDPTPDQNGKAGDCPATIGPFVCTWSTGHDGQHVAGMGSGDKIAAVWDDHGNFAVMDREGDDLQRHVAACDSDECLMCRSVKTLLDKVSEAVHGDLANWKPTGFLNQPADGPQWSTSAPPSDDLEVKPRRTVSPQGPPFAGFGDALNSPQVGHWPDNAQPTLTVVPEGLAAPLQAAQSSTSGITSWVADDLIRQVREATAQLDAITPPGDRQAIAQEVYNRAQHMGTLEATRSVYDELLNTGMVRQRDAPAEPPDGVTDCRTGTTIPPITATPIWARTPNWADNLGICTKEIGHPDLHGNGPETTERHRCDAIYHLDGPLTGIPATKAAMAANIRNAITRDAEEIATDVP